MQLRLEVSGIYDPDESHPDPPEGVIVREQVASLSFNGRDVLHLLIELDVARAPLDVAVGFASAWLYGIFKGRELTINGRRRAVTEAADIERAVRDETVGT